MLERDAVGAAHLLGHAALPFDLLDVVVPGQSLLRADWRDSLIPWRVGASSLSVEFSALVGYGLQDVEMEFPGPSIGSAK